MGICCASREQLKSPSHKKKPLKIICPICEEGLDTDDHKPLIVCENNHNLCQKCLKSLKKLAILKKKADVQCPFCKKPCFEDLIKTDVQIFNFLEKEEETLKLLPENRKKLFAFSTVYLPSLHRLMKEESQKNQKNKQKQVIKIDCIKIRGKMLEQYQIFQMDMLECLTNLKRLYLNHNQITALDLSQYTHEKLQLLDLAQNNFGAMKILTDNSEPLKHLRILNFESNKIQDIKGLRRLQMLQVLNLKKNKIKSMAGLSELKSLKDLNIEFNLIQKFEYQPYFNEIRSLSLLGNKFPESTWKEFIKYEWQELRLLTLTVNKLIFEKDEVHSLLMTTKWNYLQLIISETVEPQLEDVSAIDEKGFVLDKLAMININEGSYQIYWNQKKSFLIKAINMVKQYDRLGTNVNFRPYLYANSSYEINQNLNIVNKIKDPSGPLDYLYHSKGINASDEGYNFIQFKTKTNNIIVGICQELPPSPLTTIYIDLSKGLVSNVGVEQLVEELNKPIKESEEWECIFRVNPAQRELSLLINGTQTFVLKSIAIKKEVIFFVSLIQKSSEIQIVTLQLTD